MTDDPSRHVLPIQQMCLHFNAWTEIFILRLWAHFMGRMREREGLQATPSTTTLCTSALQIWIVPRGPQTKQLFFFFGAAYGTKCYLQRIISILKKKKGSLNCNRLRLLSQWRDGVATYLFLPESRNPLANGLRSIFSLVICRQGEHEKDMFVIRAAWHGCFHSNPFDMPMCCNQLWWSWELQAIRCFLDNNIIGSYHVSCQLAS